ncbi:MAG: hypothetical protein ABSF82_02630 [Candidatus Bathyarchaeia archaeon]
MKNPVTSKVFLIGLLLLSITATRSQIGAANPTATQIGAASKSHTTGGPHVPQSATLTTATQSSQSSDTHSNHGRQSGVPPGLVNAWAHSNMSVVARAVTHAIFLNGTHGVELAEIAINASSNGQMIRDVAFNESVVQVDLDHDGRVELSVNSSAKPTAVFADDNELSESQSDAGLTVNSNTWVYDQNSHTLTVFADPSSITIFYGSAPTPVPESPFASIAFLLIAAIAGAALVARKKVRKFVK